MARTRTRGEIKTAARQLADTVNSTHTTDTALSDWFQSSYAELYDKLVLADPDRFVTTGTISTTAGTRSYDLPAGFYIMRHVERQESSTRYTTIKRFPLQERNRWSLDDRDERLSGVSVRYRVMGSGVSGADETIYFEPDPGTNTFRIWYVPSPTQTFASDAATVDGVAGWDEWIAYDLAIRMLIKEESDTTALMAERARIEARIERMAQQRDSGEPIKVARSRARGSAWT